MEPPGGRAARLALGLALLCSALRAAAAAPAGPVPRSAVGESSWKAAAEPGGRGQRVWGSPVPADGYPARPQRGAAACRTRAWPSPPAPSKAERRVAPPFLVLPKYSQLRFYIQPAAISSQF